MIGDDNALTITSTRAILINAPKADVWKWLIQLGADRGGFFSYYFIERALGYTTRNQEKIKPEFKTMSVGDIVRGSINEESSIIPYNFRITRVEPENAFVLEGWGTFLLVAINDEQTRLIIRTQKTVVQNRWAKATNYIAIPLHFIMERRTLIGIKARSEAGENITLSSNNDLIWFFNIVFSGFLICVSAFVFRGIIQSVIIPSIFIISLILFWRG